MIFRVWYYWLPSISWLFITIIASISCQNPVISRFPDIGVHGCCNHRNDQTLLQCIINEWNSNRSNIYAETNNIFLVTSFTRNIESYAQYAIAINANYARFRGYQLKIFSETSYSNKEALDADARWNKIFFLREELMKLQEIKQYSSEVASQDAHHYLVWLDADLAVINFDLDISRVIKAHPKAHIIMSKDKKSAPFVGNTGAIIVRVSDWSKKFLELWWESYDRSRCCDQNALTWLFDRNLPHDVKEKVIFLPADAINTDFPCWQNHNDHSHVLHLAGLTNLLRVQIFQHGYDEICRTSAHALRTKQLGLNIEYIRYSMMNLLDIRVNALQALKSQLNDPFHVITVEELKRLRLEVHDIIKQDDNDPDLKLCNVEQASCSATIADEQLPMLVYEIRKLLFQKFHNIVVTLHTTSSSVIDECMDSRYAEKCSYLIELFKDMISAGFEFVIVAEAFSPNLCGEYCIETMNITGKFIDIVLESSKSKHNVQAAFLYYRFKQLLLLSSLHSSNQQKIALLKSAATTWKGMVETYQYYGTNYVIADPQKEFVETLLELGTRQCQQGLHTEGLQSLQDAIRTQEELIQGYDGIRIATDDIIHTAKFALVELLFNYALCCLEDGRFDEASSIVSRSLHHIDLLHETNNKFYSKLMDLHHGIEERKNAIRLEWVYQNMQLVSNPPKTKKMRKKLRNT